MTGIEQGISKVMTTSKRKLQFCRKNNELESRGKWSEKKLNSKGMNVHEVYSTGHKGSASSEQ